MQFDGGAPFTSSSQKPDNFQKTYRKSLNTIQPSLLLPGPTAPMKEQVLKKTPIRNQIAVMRGTKPAGPPPLGKVGGAPGGLGGESGGAPLGGPAKGGPGGPAKGGPGGPAKGGPGGPAKGGPGGPAKGGPGGAKDPSNLMAGAPAPKPLDSSMPEVPGGNAPKSDGTIFPSGGSLPSYTSAPGGSSFKPAGSGSSFKPAGPPLAVKNPPAFPLKGTLKVTVPYNQNKPDYSKISDISFVPSKPGPSPTNFKVEIEKEPAAKYWGPLQNMAYDGNDLATFKDADKNQCAIECSKNPKCVGFETDINGKNCKLKSKFENPKRSANREVRVKSGFPVPPAFKDPPSAKYGGPIKGVDYPGNDLSMSMITDRNLAARKCDQDPKCVGYVLTADGKCWTKSKLVGPVTNPNVVESRFKPGQPTPPMPSGVRPPLPSAQAAPGAPRPAGALPAPGAPLPAGAPPAPGAPRPPTIAPKPTPPPPPPPGAPPAPPPPPSQKYWGPRVGVEYYGNDVGYFQNNDTNFCAQKCDGTPACKGYITSTNTNECWLKGGFGKPTRGPRMLMVKPGNPIPPDIWRGIKRVGRGFFGGGRGIFGGGRGFFGGGRGIFGGGPVNQGKHLEQRTQTIRVGNRTINRRYSVWVPN